MLERLEKIDGILWGPVTIALLFVTGGIILIFVDRNAPAVDEPAVG